MTYQINDLAKAFVLNLQEVGAKKAVRQLAAFILENRLQNQLSDILHAVSLEYAKRGFIEADVQTAFPLSQALKSEISTYIKNRTNAKHIELNEEVDPSLLAGVVISAPDLELDTSLKTKLAKLKA